MHTLLYHFSPLILFISLYLGAGLYFAFHNVDMAFYQLSPVVAILPALILAWFLQRGTTTQIMQRFLDGARHRDILTMCFIFLLAGALGVVTKQIGCVDATINLALYLIPARFLLIGIFIASAFIATAIGTSLGTIATIAPIAAELATQGAFPMSLGMATVVGGAMFGDNLSLISDTTIAAVMSQGADWRKKLYLNGIIAGIASIITIFILLSTHDATIALTPGTISLIHVVPYLLLIGLAVCGINVFIVLIASLIAAGAIGMVFNQYTILAFNKDITAGFASMHEITILSLLVGGLSGLLHTGISQLRIYMGETRHQHPKPRTAQLTTAWIVSLFDAFIANNTIAIIFCGDFIKELTHAARIPAHYTAAWLDIFSCVVQGIIPYGAQILLASSIGGISPLSVSASVYYCYVLAAVALLYILMNKKLEA
jgi:Na+/H+ antiporter NhaC